LRRKLPALAAWYLTALASGIILLVAVVVIRFRSESAPEQTVFAISSSFLLALLAMGAVAAALHLRNIGLRGDSRGG
jgi:DMSO reductase anchor subunit